MLVHYTRRAYLNTIFTDLQEKLTIKFIQLKLV